MVHGAAEWALGTGACRMLREEPGLLFLVGTGSGGALLLPASLGFKVSGHVGIPVVLGLWAWAHGARAAVPLLGAALMMSWARPAAGRWRRAGPGRWGRWSGGRGGG